MASTSEFVEDVRDHVGESLRAISTYRGDDVEFHYIRDDMVKEYTPEEIDEIREHILLEGMQEPLIESLFNGRPLHCQMFAVGEAFAFHFNIDDTSGHFVTVDADGLDDLNAFITDCTAYSEG